MPPPTPPIVVKRYYPTLSSVVSLDDFPESLGFLKKAVENLFSKIHYKDLQYKKSPKGDAAFYSLSIVSNKLAIELFGSGISLVLNPDESETAPDFNISAFPVTVEYQWKILAYLRSFDLNNFSFTPQEFFELGLIILNISEEQAMAQFINAFTVPIDEFTTPLQQFVDDLNEYNSDQGIQELNMTIDEDTKLYEVAQEIKTLTGKYATVISFGAYLLKNDINDTKQKLGEFFKKFIPEGIESYIKDILVPKARATLTVSAAVEFPRNILYPYVQNGAIWEREPENSEKLTAPTVDYFETLKSFVKSYVAFNSYLNNNPLGYNPNADYGVNEIIEAFSFIINEDFKLEATLEAKGGVGLGGKLGLALVGGNARVALSGFAEINYKGKLYEEGKFTDLEIADPLRMVQEEIHKILSLKTTNNRIGAKAALILTKI
jgi:hypothetical protein